MADEPLSDPSIPFVITPDPADLLYIVTDALTVPLSGKCTVSALASAISPLIVSQPFVTNFRLTTESGVPVSVSDRTAQGTIYFTPYSGNLISLYDGSSWVSIASAQVSLGLTVTSGKNYDIFAYSNAGVLTLELSAAWTDDTTRANALTLQDGVTVKSGALTRRWIGTIRASGSNVTADSGGGVTTQVGGQRFVWNAYNQVPRAMRVIDTTDNWSYTTGVIRQANGAAGNLVEYVTGDVASSLDAIVQGVAAIATNAARAAKVGIGIDSTTTFSGLVQGGFNNVVATAEYAPIFGRYSGQPGLGYHYFSWNETGADGICVFLGDNGGDGQQTGLTAWILG